MYYNCNTIFFSCIWILFLCFSIWHLHSYNVISIRFLCTCTRFFLCLSLISIYICLAPALVRSRVSSLCGGDHQGPVVRADSRPTVWLFYIYLFYNYLLIYSYLPKICPVCQDLLFLFLVLHPFTLQIKLGYIIACVAKGAKQVFFLHVCNRMLLLSWFAKSVYFADCWKFRKFAKHLDFPLFAEIKFSRFNLTWRAAAKEVNLQHALQQDKLFL